MKGLVPGFDVVIRRVGDLLEPLHAVYSRNSVGVMVRSDINIPPLDNSAMDGYAVQWDSIRGATSSQPKTLKVIGEVAAGYISDREVTPGAAIRIMTGIPAGADTVIQVLR